jgi:signal transduction histidine kinase
LYDRGGEAVLSVRDNGPGIAREHLERIFQRFERVGSRHGVSGLGLGLHIPRHIVEAHGGRVWAESAPDEGTTFTVVFPDAGATPERSPRPLPSDASTMHERL